MPAILTYISVRASTVTKRRVWRVIHRGIPLCADRDSALEALHVYEEFVHKKENHVPLWDGDRGGWDTLDTLELELPE
jgi:hypothetical protein